MGVSETTVCQHLNVREVAGLCRGVVATGFGHLPQIFP